jgi:outer membrane protein
MLVGLSCLPHSLAQAEAPPLTLKAAYQAAIIRSETLKDADEQVLQAEEHVKQARGSIFPTVAGFASYYQQADPSNRPPSLSSPSNQSLVKLTATQPLFRGLREFAALRQASTFSDAQASARKQAELSLFVDVAQSYLTVAALEQDLRNLESERGLFGKRIGELKSRVRIGRTRPAEVLTLDSSLKTIEAQVAQVSGQLRSSREALAFVTGLPETTPIAGAPDAIPPPPVSAAAVAAPESVEGRPDVQAAELRAKAFDQGIWVAKGAHLPSLDLSGNYYLRRTGPQDGIDWDFTLGLTVPIFSGGVTQSKVRETVSQSRQSELALSRTRRAASEELRSLLAAVESDREQLKGLAEAKDLASRNYESQTRDYRLGLVTNLDVLQALSAFQESARSLDKLKFQAHLDVLRLQTATGTLPNIAF